MESETTPQSEGAPGGSSLAAKLVNVFAAPGEVFDDIKARPAAAKNWAVPVALCIVMGIVFTLVVFSQPNIQQQIREAQDKAFQQRVTQGKMTQDQVDKAEAFLDKYMGIIMTAVGIIQSVLMTVVRLFWWGLVLWLVGRWFMRVQFPYLKGVEVAGLTMMITVLGMIVSLLLVMIVGKLSAGPHLGFLVGNFDPTNKLHIAMAAANIFSFWYVAVVSAGLAKLANVSFARAAVVIFPCWLAWEALLIVTGLGQFAM